MAVDTNELYAVMRAFIRERDSAGLKTNTQQLRLMLEYGEASTRTFLSSQAMLTNPGWLSREGQGGQDSCWINLRGMCFWIDYGWHSHFAGLMTGRDDPSILEDAGWVHVSDKHMDIVMEPTDGQRRTIERLEDEGFRRGDLRRIGSTRRPSEQMHRGLEAIERPDYDWQDPRYWENRGIPREAHGIRGEYKPVPDEALIQWLGAMENAAYDTYGAAKFNHEYVPIALSMGRYVGSRAKELREEALKLQGVSQ